VCVFMCVVLLLLLLLMYVCARQIVGHCGSRALSEFDSELHSRLVGGDYCL
jgi:nitrogen fixation/metabolism regulation signal transduction histidine kinase